MSALLTPSCIVTVRFTKPPAEPIPAVPGIIPVKQKKKPLSHEWEKVLGGSHTPSPGLISDVRVSEKTKNQPARPCHVKVSSLN